MLEKAKHMTIAEMKDERDFMVAVFSIPELHRENPVCMWGAEDYGPGRHAKAEYSSETHGYDYLYAELCNEKDAEKSRVRNRRRADRKYKELPKERKYREEMRKDRLFGYCGNYDCPKVVGRPNSMMIADRKRINAESVMRSDWDAEYADIVEDIEWAFFDAEYCNEQIDIIERRDPLLENGNNYVRWNRMWEKINKYNEVIRKNRFAEELANEQFGFINWGEG